MSSAVQTVSKPILEALRKTYGEHSGTLESVAELALLVDRPLKEVEQALSDPETMRELEAEALRADADGTATLVTAQKAMAVLVRKIYGGVNDLDISEIPAIARTLSRVIEHGDKVRLAEFGTDNLPVIHVSFGMELRTEVVKPGVLHGAVEVVQDVTSRAYPKEAAQPRAAELLQVLDAPLIPLSMEGGEEWRP